jgi:hypothetical protein
MAFFYLFIKLNLDKKTISNLALVIAGLAANAQARVLNEVNEAGDIAS